MLVHIDQLDAAGVMVVSESRPGPWQVVNTISYRGRAFEVQTYAVFYPGEAVQFRAGISEAGCYWEESGNGFDDGEAAFLDAINDIIATVDDDADGNR